MENQVDHEKAEKKVPKIDADNQVRATEDASLQDDSYAFDEDTTSNEDIHDVSDFGEVDPDLLDSVDAES